VVQDDELVFDGDVGGKQIGDRLHDAAGRQIAAAVVVAAAIKMPGWVPPA